MSSPDRNNKKLIIRITELNEKSYSYNYIGKIGIILSITALQNYFKLINKPDDYIKFIKYIEEECRIIIPEDKRKSEEIINNFKDAPAIVYTGNSASYTKSSDVIRMPEKSSFINEEEFYSTLFHELGHSTGHEKRLDRDSLTAFSAFGDVIYSKEELVAEFCSSFLCHKSGISNVTLDNSASYIQGWSKFLRDNPTALVQASSQAKKASEYILNNRQVRE